MSPETKIGLLERPDGSSSFSDNGYSVLAAVNGPIEVQRRDELPEEAALEVIVRPSAGVGGVRERHFESIVQRALKRVIRVGSMPRTLIQITLQVTAIPDNKSAPGKLPQAASNLQIMPALLNGAVLALLDTSIALDMMLSATLIAIMPDGEVLSSPSPSQLDKSASIHAFAFTSDGELVLVESEGSFDMDQWEEAAEKAQHICLHKPIGENPERMEDSEMNGEGLVETMKNAIGAKVALDRKWRQGVK